LNDISNQKRPHLNKNYTPQNEELSKTPHNYVLQPTNKSNFQKHYTHKNRLHQRQLIKIDQSPTPQRRK
tara:strand:- start:174 stop:380 length:207 start_codon:yes stop_codon:yes gene_type:complete